MTMHLERVSSDADNPVDSLKIGDTFTIAGVYEKDDRTWLERAWDRLRGVTPERELKQFTVTGVEIGE